MATTKADVQYVQIDRVQFWADKESGDIHITTDDPDAKEVFKHTTISNKETSKRYHPTFYRQLAQLLTQYGKDVPGWVEDGPADATQAHHEVRATETA